MDSTEVAPSDVSLAEKSMEPGQETDNVAINSTTAETEEAVCQLEADAARLSETMDDEAVNVDAEAKDDVSDDQGENDDDDDDSLEDVPLSKRKKKVRVLSDDEDDDDDEDETANPEDDDDDEEEEEEEEDGAEDETRTLRLRNKSKFACKNCGKGYTKPAGRDAHYEECKNKKMPFKCNECNRSYARKTQLQSHQKTHTGAKPHQCGVCGKRFAWSNQLSQHAKTHEIGGKPFKCSQCGECYAEAVALVQHVKIHPKEKKHECSICGEMFSMIRDLRRHEVIHALDEDPEGAPTSDAAQDLLSQTLQQSGLKPYGCPVCGKSFNRNEYLIQHMRMHTGEKPHECGECGDKFTWHNQLAFHAKLHPEGRPFKCQQCDEKFAESAELAKHARIHPKKKLELTQEDINKALAREGKSQPPVESAETEEDDDEEDDDEDDPNYVDEQVKFKPYGCDQCGKFFARKLQLTSHQRTHTGEKPHACGLCDSKFSWSNQLSNHIKTNHPGEKAYKCSNCDVCFLTSRELVRHNKTHGSHSCAPCDMVFPNLRSFVKHTKTVHGLSEPPKKRGRKPKEKSSSKDFQCDFCGICFARRDNLKEHLRVHTGAKPFQCDICGKFFRLMGHLVKHKRTHTGEKPYRCETCYKCFTDSSKLARHVQMHTGSRPFICRTCYRYFPKKELLVEHSKTHAGERKIRKPQNRVELTCDTCDIKFTGAGDNTKCKNCRQITYECGICGDQFLDSNDLLEHTKLHSGDWAYQYIPQELGGQELTGQAIIQGTGYEFTTRQGGNLVIDVPAGATQEVIECILSSSDIVMQGQQQDGNLTLVNQVQQQQIQLQNEPIQQVNPNDMIQHEAVPVQIQPIDTPVNMPLEPIPEEAADFDDDDDMEDDFFADLETQQGEGKGKPFECPDCGKKFRREKWMFRHRRQHVKQEEADQDMETEEPDTLSAAEDEPEMDDDDEDYEEELKPKKRGPGRPRKNNDSDYRAKTPKQKKNGYECTVCGKCFASAKWLARHKDTPHTCAKCDKVFLRAKSLKEHMKTHTQEAKYKCPLCQEPQMKFVSLLKHCALHEEGNYRCPSCNKLFKKLENMVKHTRYHNQGVQHQCETCGKSFWQKWSLRQHLKVHSGEQPYQCETCGKCFTNIGNYKSHNRVHTGEKPYICETCGKAFREGGHLVKHRRTHTGEKPYVCGTCNACFTDSSKLARHTKTQHSNFGKGYKCETCGKCFSRIDNLHTHEKTHTGEKVPRKSPAKSRQQQMSGMITEQDRFPFDRIQTIEIEHEAGNTAEEMGQVRTIEILHTGQEQNDQRSDQQFLTLLVQRLNQGDDSRVSGQTLNVASVSALEPQVRVMADPHAAHQVRTLQGYNIPGGHPMHAVHQMQMQRPNVLNQFANVVDDYAIHYPAFLHRK